MTIAVDIRAECTTNALHGFQLKESNSKEKENLGRSINLKSTLKGCYSRQTQKWLLKWVNETKSSTIVSKWIGYSCVEIQNED